MREALALETSPPNFKAFVLTDFAELALAELAELAELALAELAFAELDFALNFCCIFFCLLGTASLSSQLDVSVEVSGVSDVALSAIFSSRSACCFMRKSWTARCASAIADAKPWSIPALANVAFFGLLLEAYL